MSRKHTACPNCKPGVHRCDRHKHPGRNTRKKLAREKLLADQDLSQSVDDKDVVEHRRNDFSKKHQEKKKNKPQHIIFDDPSTVKRFDSSDLEAILTPTIKAVAESVASILTSKGLHAAVSTGARLDTLAAAQSAAARPAARSSGTPVPSAEQPNDNAMQDIVSSATEPEGSSIDKRKVPSTEKSIDPSTIEPAENSDSTQPETGSHTLGVSGAPDTPGDSDGSDNSDDESDSDETDYVDSDFGDKSDDSSEEGEAEDDDGMDEDGSTSELESGARNDRDRQSVVDDDAELSLASKKRRELNQKRKENRLDQKLVDLYEHVGALSALGIFAESFLDIEEKFQEEADLRQIPITDVTILKGVLTHNMTLEELLTLQPSSPMTDVKASWLSDDMIHNVVNLLTRDDLVEGSEFLNPTLTGTVMSPDFSREQTLIRINDMIDDHTSIPFHPKTSSTRLVGALAFPEHWTMYAIDSATEEITFVDSLPDEGRRQYAREKVVCPTPAKQANYDDCGTFTAHNATMCLTGHEFQKTKGVDEARNFAIRTKWQFLEVIRDLALGNEGPKDRLEAVLSGRALVPDASTIDRAKARIEALSKVTHKETPQRTKGKPEKKSKMPKTGNDRKLSKSQKKIISPKSFLPSCVSGVRDLVLKLLSTPDRAGGMSVEDMEHPIRTMIEREKFTIPETWDVKRLLRVILDRQDHHFSELENDKWVGTKILSRELSGRYLNELRAKRCSPTPSPLEHPAMLHIFISLYSGTVSKVQMGKLDQSYESRIKTTNALFGAAKQQPETKPYAQGTLAYPMHIRCTLPNVQATDLLQNMLARHQCTTALQELSRHAEQTFQDDPTFEGRFTYRVIISGLEGGSVNNDSWEDLRRVYPRLRGQLLIFDDRSIPAPDSSLVTQNSMMDWATPACLLSKSQREKGIHRHVVWGMFDMEMLAKEWTRESAPRVAGPLHAKIEQDQQLLACRKLLLSNSLLYYWKIDCSIAAMRDTSEYTDPAVIATQTSCANVGEGRNDFVADRCVPELEPFARECRWCGSHEPIDTWALSYKPPQGDEPLVGFCCDRPECYVLEVEECRRSVA
ncbi:hypothetical protein E4T44_05037 [Aureobasidium sp. EXF-8845]|nr:hypothetical protein E4T44_05037 [Aureobasidium sp. EXF-8845]KAI4851802.1 hypothetical protein E4T45_04936 [Aureobasidium sp. EXF-8846]